MNAKPLVNAIIGASVTVVTSFVPLSPILGGAVAAWLEGSDRRDGLMVGTLSGALLALLLLPFLFFGLLLIPFDLGFTFVVMLFLVFVGAIYLVGFSALGGYVGAYLRDEFGFGSRSDARNERPYDR